MYLCQRSEQVRRDYPLGQAVGWRVIFFRVELDTSGRPIWRETGRSAVGDHPYLTRRRHGIKGVPFLPRPRNGKLVTGAEAARLTGLEAPAALDYLAETVSESETVQNYVRPKRERPARPDE